MLYSPAITFSSSYLLGFWLRAELRLLGTRQFQAFLADNYYLPRGSRYYFGNSGCIHTPLTSVVSNPTFTIKRISMKYDDASWHYGGDFPVGQPDEHGGTHIALFLKWCFLRGWAGDLHTDEAPEAVTHVVEGRLSATEFLFDYCDGKFTDEDLNDEGNSFAIKYYGDAGLYLEDYAENFGNQMYVAPEAEHDFARFSAMLDARLASGVLENLKKP